MSRARFLHLTHLWRPALLAVSVLGLMVSLGACASSPKNEGTAPSSKDGPRLSFQEREHNFGTVSNSRPAQYRFAFTNTGSHPLGIQEIRLEPARLGAWTWGVEAVASSATINPSESGHVLVTFNRPMIGMRDLFLKVPSNDPVEPTQVLTLRFEVVP